MAGASAICVAQQGRELRKRTLPPDPDPILSAPLALFEAGKLVERPDEHPQPGIDDYSRAIWGRSDWLRSFGAGPGECAYFHLGVARHIGLIVFAEHRGEVAERKCYRH
jgi:hypothetical protein